MIDVEFVFNELRCTNLSKTVDKLLSTGRINTAVTPLMSLAVEQQDDSSTLAYILLVLTDKQPNEEGQTVRLNVKVPFFFSDGSADDATSRAKRIYLRIIQSPSRLIKTLCQTLADHQVEALRLQSFDAATGKPVIDVLDTSNL